MNENTKYTTIDKISNNENIIIKKALENEVQEDKVIRIFTKEITSFIIRLFKSDTK